MDEALREDPYAFAAHIGLVMTDWREGYAAFDVPLEPFLMNRHGNPHGGCMRPCWTLSWAMPGAGQAMRRGDRCV